MGLAAPECQGTLVASSYTAAVMRSHFPENCSNAAAATAALLSHCGWQAAPAVREQRQWLLQFCRVAVVMRSHCQGNRFMAEAAGAAFLLHCEFQAATVLRELATWQWQRLTNSCHMANVGPRLLLGNLLYSRDCGCRISAASRLSGCIWREKTRFTDAAASRMSDASVARKRTLWQRRLHTCHVADISGCACR